VLISEQAVLVRHTRGPPRFIPISEVAGMAKLPAASDLPYYVGLTGREPVLKEPRLLWVIQMEGDVPQLGGGSPTPGEVWRNPTCFVTNSDQGYVATGPTTNLSTAMTTQPEAPAVPPDRTLPALGAIPIESLQIPPRWAPGESPLRDR
jgi:hypothetical protein